MAGSSKKPKKRSLLTERNRIRGLIGASKSTRVILGDRKPDKTQQTQVFQQGLAAALVQAREAIAGSQFDEFLIWLESQTSTLLSQFSSFKTNSELLGAVLDAHPLPLGKEIMWTAARLLQHDQRLSEFQSRVKELETLVWRHPEWHEIEHLIDSLETDFGKSLWLLEARIALGQDFVGMEHQKKIAAHERQLKQRGLRTFVSHYLSVRNEPSTVGRRFAADFENLLNKEHNAALHDFLRYRLLGVTSGTHESLSNILRISQGLAEVDLYESLIFVCEQLVADGIDDGLASTVLSALSRLQHVTDPRVSKILLLLGHYRANRFVQRDLSAADAALTCSDRKVIQRALRVLQKDPHEFKAALLAAGHLGDSSLRVDGPALGWGRIIRDTARVLQFSENYDSELDTLQQFLANHSFFSHIKAYSSNLRADMRSTLESGVRARRIAAMNNPFLDPDEVCLIPVRARAAYLVELKTEYGDSPSLQIQLQSLDLEMPESRCRPLSSDVLVETVDGLAELTTIGTHRPARIARWRSVLEGLVALQGEMYQNNLSNVVRQIARLYLALKVPLSAIPVVSGIAHYKWKQLKQCDRDLALAISLHLCWRSTNTEEAATQVRFAYDALLEAFGVTSAAQLATVPTLNNDELTYFLKNVCVPSVMDMNKHIGSSRAADIERRKICSALCEFDPSHREDYEGEIVSLVNAEALEDGIRLVDSSRVHVDVNPLKAWAKREWAANFERYRALSKAGVATSKDLDVLLKEVLRQTHTSVLLLQAPDSEADQLLVEMVFALQNKFLTDPQHGLDSYLSRRVRHHSMGGYLRGPLEESNLITFKVSAKRYAENTWVDQVGTLTPRERERLVRHFDQFAEEVDRTIAYLKSNLFRVRSEEHPRGIFDVPVSPSTIHLVRSIFRTDPTIDEFCHLCFLIFWTSLEPSLQLAQRQLRTETKNTLSGAFHRLRASLKKTLVDPKRYAELSAAISAASEKVLRETDRIADWFIRKEVHTSPINYSLSKAFEIAMKSALESHRPFEPDVQLELSGEHPIRTSDLVAIAEIVLTTTGNAKQYSEGLAKPTMQISVRCESGVIKLRIENRVSLKFSRSSAAPRLETIRRQISDGSYVDRVKSEGESGLMKIASTVSLYPHGDFNFGFVDERTFYTDVSIDLA